MCETSPLIYFTPADQVLVNPPEAHNSLSLSLAFLNVSFFVAICNTTKSVKANSFFANLKTAA